VYLYNLYFSCAFWSNNKETEKFALIAAVWKASRIKSKVKIKFHKIRRKHKYCFECIHWPWHYEYFSHFRLGLILPCTKYEERVGIVSAIILRRVLRMVGGFKKFVLLKSKCHF
jgi:hypothetical protein